MPAGSRRGERVPKICQEGKNNMAPKPGWKPSQPSCKEHMTISYIVLEWAERPHWEPRAQLPGIPALHLAAPVVFGAVTFTVWHRDSH